MKSEKAENLTNIAIAKQKKRKTQIFRLPNGIIIKMLNYLIYLFENEKR
jgi:hypothetical protein